MVLCLSGSWKAAVVGRKRYMVEAIVRRLREAEVELSAGATIKQVDNKLGATNKRTTAGARSTGAFKSITPVVSKSLRMRNSRLEKLVAKLVAEQAPDISDPACCPGPEPRGTRALTRSKVKDLA